MVVVIVLTACFAWDTAIASAESIATFNDLTVGTLSGQAGGSGWSDSWTTSAASTYETVVSGDLTYSKYNYTTTGTSQCAAIVGGASSSTVAGTNVYRTLTDSVSSGSVWISFLALANSSSGARVGIGLNESGSYVSNNRILLIDNSTTARLYAQLAGQQALNNTNVGSLNTTYLILVKVTMNSGSDGKCDRVQIWLAPDLTIAASESDLSSATELLDTTAYNIGDALSTVSITGYGCTSGGYLDNLLVGTFEQVTAVPEPQSLLLCTGGLFGLLAFARRKWGR